MKLSKKKERLLKLFNQCYPHPASELDFLDEYQLVIAVVLSAQSTDKKVNELTPALFTRYPDFKALSNATTEAVEPLIRQINYYKTKSRNIIALAKMVMENFGGNLPREHSLLIELPGVGNKTANVVLSELQVTHTFPVDTHVFRLAHRLGLADGSTPDKVEFQLRKGFPPVTWRNLHHWLILHGRRICKAQNPKCPECAIALLCPSRKLFTSSAKATSESKKQLREVVAREAKIRR